MAISTADVTAQIRVHETNALDLAPNTTTEHLARLAITFQNGTGLNQANAVFSDRRTLSASANEDLDLAGVLVSAFGATLTFTKIKAIFVGAAAANTNNVVVGGAAATQFVGPFGAATHTVAVPPGGVFMIATPTLAGWAVAAGSTDFLRIANSAGGTSVTYDILILGAV
jgi:hypothetical protein